MPSADRGNINIVGVATAAEETGRAADQVLGAASELSRQFEHLSGEVDRFLATIQAASGPGPGAPSDGSPAAIPLSRVLRRA